MNINLFSDFDFDYPNDLVKKEDLESDERLLSDIREIGLQMEAAKARFENFSDSDLLEASIYELQSLNARYRYLIKLAKERNMKSSEIGSLYSLQVG